METVAQAARAALSNPEPSPSSTAFDEIARLNKRDSKLWLRMGELYGHKWASQMGTAPSELWLKALSGLSDEQVKVGVNACLYSEDQWPPSLPEFVARCRPSKRENAAAYRYVPMLPHPPVNEPLARKAIDAMKAKVQAVIAADAAKPKPATLLDGIDDYAWFSSRSSEFDAAAPLRNQGIVK